MPTDNPIKITPIYCESDTVYDGEGTTIVGDNNLLGSEKDDLVAFVIYKDTKNVIIKNYNFVNLGSAIQTRQDTRLGFENYKYPWGGVRDIHVTNCTMYNDIGEDPFISYSRQRAPAKLQGTKTGSGAVFSTGQGTSPVNCSITNCTLTGRVRLLTTGKYSRNWLIADNYLNGCEDTSIYVKGFGHRILRNTVLNSGKDGIKVLQQGTVNPSEYPGVGVEYSAQWKYDEVTKTFGKEQDKSGGKNEDQLWWGYTLISDNYSGDWGLIKPDAGGAYMLWAPCCILQNNVGRVTKWGNSGNQKYPDPAQRSSSSKSTFEWSNQSYLGISRNNIAETIDPDNPTVYRARYYRPFNIKETKRKLYYFIPMAWRPDPAGHGEGGTIDRLGDSVVYVKQGQDPSPWDSSEPWVLNGN